VAINEPFDYCFAYPQGFTQQVYNDQVEVIGPHFGLGGLVAGLVWIDATDAQGCNAQMETLFASVTSSWVWMSSGKPCPATE